MKQLMQWNDISIIPPRDVPLLLSDGENVYTGFYGETSWHTPDILSWRGNNRGYDGDDGPAEETIEWMFYPIPSSILLVDTKEEGNWQ